ncbi:MAG: TonB-dependent receptor [Opitutae bacterium]|nr:TonB-dependent receptor [Opitutae bacterium]
MHTDLPPRITLFSRCRALLATGLFLLAALGLPAADTAPKTFDLPADLAARSLKNFSNQSGIEVLIRADLGGEVKTQAVRGTMSPREALERMLQGTTLEVVADPRSGALAVRAKPAPVPEKNVPSAAPDQAAGATGSGTGALIGRVQDAATGRYMENVRISAVNLNRQTFTSATGEYELANLPAGPVEVRAFFTGRQIPAATVTVESGRAVIQDFTLLGVYDKAMANKEGAVLLDEFVVTEKQNNTAAEIAINEQRFSDNIKTVVSTEAFGEIAQNNLGEFLKYMPGVEPVYSSMNVTGVQLRGFPAGMTNISIDGAAVTVPGGSGSTERTVNFQAVSLSNASRIEVSKLPLANQSASSLGGSINLVSRSAFERSRAELSYRAYLNMNSHFANFRKTPGGRLKDDGNSYKFAPDFDINYVNPLSKTVGIAINASRNDQWTLGRRPSMSWVYDTKAGSTPANPYMGTFNDVNLYSFEDRSVLGFKIDWKVSPRDVVSLSASSAYYFSNYGLNQIWYAVGSLNPTPANGIRTAADGLFSEKFVQGRPGAGTVYQSVTPNYNGTANSTMRLSYKHLGADWDWDATFGANKSKLWIRSNPDSSERFQNPRANITGTTVRFDEIGPYGPGKITVTNTAGQTIDPLNLSSYNQLVINAADRWRDTRSNARTLDLNLKRKFSNFAGDIQGGFAYRSDYRDRTYHQRRLVYNGPGNNISTAALPTGSLVDAGFSTYTLSRGRKAPQWLSSIKFADLYQAHPEYFSYTAANAVTDFKADVGGADELQEEVSALYLLGRASFLRSKLSFVGGVRLERTEDFARGVLVDNSLQYQQANGKMVDGDPTKAGIQPIAISTDAMEVARLTNLMMGRSINIKYDNCFPSFQVKYLATENLQFRLGYAKTLGRPEYSRIIPATTINELTSPADSPYGLSWGTISANNPKLKPWIADNFEFAGDYYTKQGGVFSINLYRKNIRNFFMTTYALATQEFLDQHSLPPEALNYVVSYMENFQGVMHNTGIELSADQRVLKDLRVFANLSLNRLVGNENAAAEFRGYNPRRINVGFTYNKRALTFIAKFSHTAETRTTPTTGIDPNGWIRVGERNRLDASIDYRVSKHATVFVSGRNIFNDRDKSLAVGPVTPAYAQLYQEQDYGVLFQVGVKGTF